MRADLRCVALLVLVGVVPWSAHSQISSSPIKTPTGYADAELPRWAKLSGEARLRVEALDGILFRPAGNTYLLSRVRLNFDATPGRWLRLSFQAQDSRVFFTNVSPLPSSQQDPIDLRVGFVQVGRSEESPVRLRVGRQPLDFGEGRLVADPNWSNVGRSFDAARLTLQSRGIRIDAFAGTSDKIYIDGLATLTPGEHFDGLYTSFNQVIPKAVVEPYVFWKMEHKVKGEQIKTGNLDEKTFGIRWVGKLPLRLDYGMETVLQRGSSATEPISAWATHLVTGITLPDTRHLPRLYAEFNRGSGDESPKDGVHGAFDVLFPSTHDKFGLADQFGWTNLLHVRAGLQYLVRRNLTIGAAESGFWLSTRKDGIYGSNGKLAVVSNGSDGRFIGQEPDAQARWSVTKQTQLDFAAGHIFAGEFLQKSSHTGFNSVIIGVTQGF